MIIHNMLKILLFFLVTGQNDNKRVLSGFFKFASQKQ